MSDNKDEILVRAEDLQTMIDFLDRFDGPVPLRARTALDMYNLRKDAKMEQWAIVEPKPSRNNLRAGDTAYGRAVVLSMSPFRLASPDKKFTWEKLDPEHFVPVGRADMETIVSLNTKFLGYPIIG